MRINPFNHYQFNRLYAYFSIPALAIHELLHIVTGFFCGYYFSIKESRYVRNKDGSIGFLLEEKNHKKTMLKSCIVSLSPLYMVIAVAVLTIFYPCCRYLLTYLLITFKYSLPSKGDWDKVRYHKLFKNYLDNHRAMSLFFHLKGYYKNNDKDENLDFLDIDIK